MQKSLRKFAEDRPEKASKLGILSSPDSSSDSDTEYKPEKKQGRQRKTQEKQKPYIESDDDSTLDTFTALAGTRKRKNASSKEPEKPPEIIRK